MDATKAPPFWEKDKALPVETLGFGEMSRGRRGEVDTSAPFGSVKEAVDRFGERAVWNSQLKMLFLPEEFSGIPWGVAVKPFSQADEHGISPAHGSDGHLLPHYENCWAYFNTYRELEQWAWTCALCGSLNGLPFHAIQHYSKPQACAEMSSSFIYLELPVEDSAEAMQVRPVYLAAIDLAFCSSNGYWTFI